MIMEHISLNSLIEYLERGTKVHICVAFLHSCGNRKTRCTENQTIHDRPVCLAAKQQPKGLALCYRCRMTVQKMAISHRKSIAGHCTNGVYEYCRPVIYDGKVICVVFVGNILPKDPGQRKKLTERVGQELLQTMETEFSDEDCVRVADILESYIMLLFDRYGMENKTFDPLIENIKSYIRENLSYDIAMEDIASAFNYSPKHLGRLFKQRCEMTVKEYCNREKVNRAKRLLAETDLPIDRVAVEAGFSSATYFDRVFRKITDRTPQMYRQKAKENK